VDEAVVASKLKDVMEKKSYEVFFPVNTKLKDVDLILHHLQKPEKTISIQVKGSITYRTNKKGNRSRGMRRYDEPHSWSKIKGSSIFNTANHVDFIIFVIYKDEIAKDKREIHRDFLVIPMDDFRELTKQKSIGGKGHYDYYFVVTGKKVYEIREKDNKEIDFSKYLNDFKSLLNYHLSTKK
jgi:hypothetical protein